MIEVKNADLSRKQLDFILVDSLDVPEQGYIEDEWDFEI